MLYDKGLMSVNRDWIITLPRKNEEKQFVEEFPEFEKYVKAFKRERSQIERAFGVALSKFSILNKAYRGRGKRYLRLGQIALFAAQITNLIFAYEKFENCERTSLVDLNPPRDFSELLSRCT